MFRLLRFELRKLFRQKSFYIFIAIVLAFGIISVFTTDFMNKDLGIDYESSGLKDLMAAVSNNSLAMVLGIFAALFVCEDFAGGTIRVIVSRGYSRLGVFVSKYLALIAAAFIMTAVNWVFAYFLGNGFWGVAEQGLGAEQVKLLLCQLLLVVAYATVYYAICSAIQKTGGAIACCVLLSLLLRMLLVLADKALADTEIIFSSYWLDDLISSVSTVQYDSGAVEKCLICGGAYITGGLLLSWLSLFKREY